LALEIAFNEFDRSCGTDDQPVAAQHLGSADHDRVEPERLGTVDSREVGRGERLTRIIA
jgi:hypothetical protein